MNQGQVNADVANARATGQALQNQYNQQANQSYGQYQDSYANSQAAQKALEGYKVQSGGDLYNRYLQGAQSMYGFDPKALALANQNLYKTQVAMNMAPQAAAQGGNYYGATAGQTEAAYQNMAGNIGNTLSNQNAAVNQYNNLLQATQAQAGAQTGAETTTQGQNITQLNDAAVNAAQIMQNAEKTMNDIENLQQQQGSLTSKQISDYQNAYSNYVQAQGQYLSGQGTYMSGQAALNNQAFNQKLITDYTQAVQAAYGFDPNKGKTGGLSGSNLKEYNNTMSALLGVNNKVTSGNP